MNQYKEVPNLASRADLQKYADGIGQVDNLVERLHSEGRLPERFTPEPSRLHTSIEGKIRIEPWTMGGKDGQTLLGGLTGRGRKIGSYARSMVESLEFTTLPEPTTIEVGLLKVGDLGIKKDYPTTADIIGTKDDVDEQGNSAPFSKGRINELGLELLPAEALLHCLLENGDKLQLGEPLIAGMKPIAASDGNPHVFHVERLDDGLWLGDSWADPDYEWGPDDRFVFGLRK